MRRLAGAEPDRIAARLQGPEAARRPALTTAGTLAEIATVLAVREPLYREVADLVVATADRTPDQVASAILDALGGEPS